MRGLSAALKKTARWDGAANEAVCSPPTTSPSKRSRTSAAVRDANQLDRRDACPAQHGPPATRHLGACRSSHCRAASPTSSAAGEHGGGVRIIACARAGSKEARRRRTLPNFFGNAKGASLVPLAALRKRVVGSDDRRLRCTISSCSEAILGSAMGASTWRLAFSALMGGDTGKAISGDTGLVPARRWASGFGSSFHPVRQGGNSPAHLPQQRWSARSLGSTRPASRSALGERQHRRSSGERQRALARAQNSDLNALSDVFAFLKTGADLEREELPGRHGPLNRLEGRLLHQRHAEAAGAVLTDDLGGTLVVGIERLVVGISVRRCSRTSIGWRSSEGAPETEDDAILAHPRMRQPGRTPSISPRWRRRRTATASR